MAENVARPQRKTKRRRAAASHRAFPRKLLVVQSLLELENACRELPTPIARPRARPRLEITLVPLVVFNYTGDRLGSVIYSPETLGCFRVRLMYKGREIRLERTIWPDAHGKIAVPDTATLQQLACRAHAFVGTNVPV